MPPKKNVTKTGSAPKTAKEKVKVPKPRLKKEKPKLKTPTVLKVKIRTSGHSQKASPIKEDVVNTVNAEAPIVIPATKLDIINEVARAQLVKNSPVHIDGQVPEKKKRGRKKKIQPETVPTPVVAPAEDTNTCAENTEKEAECAKVVKKKKVSKKKKIQTEPDTEPEPSEEAIPPKKVRGPPRIRSTSNELTKEPKVEAAKTPKKNLKSTKPVLARKRAQSKVNGTDKKSTRGKATDEDLISPLGEKTAQTVKPTAEPLVSSTKCVAISPKDKPPVPKTVKRKYVKRKKVIDEDSTITSPSILSQGLLDKTHDKEIQKPLKMAAENNKNSDSRRTSVTSASEWSWTKDISGSSTTTCITVASNDFVRIDGKLPVVKLNNCDALVVASNPVSSPVNPPVNPVETEKIDEESLIGDCSSSSSSSSSESSIASTKSTTTTADNFLNLSTSSVSPLKLTPRSTPNLEANNEAHEKLSTLEKLSLTLKRFNLGFHSWNEKDGQHLTQMETYEKTIFKVMSEEHSVLLECGFLSQILTNKCIVSDKIGDTAEVAEKGTDFAKPSNCIASKSVHEAPKRRDSMAYDPNDDDDALSIFAESLTGFDSSRVSSNASVAPEAHHEEYIPRPIRDTWAPVERTYKPSRIEDIPPSTKKLVCEKQNADSTSLHKEPEVAPPDVIENSTENSVVRNEEQERGDVIWDQQQKLTIDCFEARLAMKSSTLKGVCFFNLISKCKKLHCRYPHWPVPESDFNTRLNKLSEELFIQEYLLIVRFSSLRIKYTPCFVSECQRRELPIILVEMVILFIRKSNPFSSVDVACKVDAIESTLLYLNNVDIALYENRLTYGFIDGKYLCEVFMETIANTQNFWRFKPVFLALAGFMVREKRTFALEVAAHILERVCIFKFEQPLALVLLSIIELTDVKIFENSMMGTFEKQLQSDVELYERFLEAKGRGAEAPQQSPARSLLALSQEPEPPSSIALSDPENRYTSPDTTNLDHLNKPTTEPIITRTVNLDKIRTLTSSTPQSFKRLSQDWSRQTIYDRIPRFTPPRHPLKRPMGRQVLYGPRHCKYPRRSGPDYYGNQ